VAFPVRLAFLVLLVRRHCLRLMILVKRFPSLKSPGPHWTSYSLYSFSNKAFGSACASISSFFALNVSSWRRKGLKTLPPSN
jgi:hypothetical protein